MMNHSFHSNTGFVPPWSTPTQWQEANGALSAVLGTRSHRFLVVQEVADQINARLSYLDRYMTALCADTCSSCVDNCCHRATVWYDFKDLLGFHLGKCPIPAAQLSPSPKRPCQNLRSTGCALPRGQRPFICSWYLCTAQRESMAAWPSSDRHYLANSLTAIKSARNRVEKLFIDSLQTW